MKTGEVAEEIPQLAGRTVHYLANESSAPLMEGEEFHGEKVQIQGRLFANAATLEVEEFGSPQ